MSYDDEWSYADTARLIKWTLVAVVVVVIIGVAGWQFDWWLTEKNAEKQAEISETHGGTQQNRADRVRDLIRDFNVLDPSNAAGRNAVRIDACDLIDRLDDAFLTDNIQQFADAECE